MRVLHLLKTSEGAAWALRLMKELVQSGIEVHVALPKGGQLYDDYTKNGIHVHPIDFSLKNIFSSVRQLQQIVRTVNPDIIHSHFVLTTLIMRMGLGSFMIPRVFEVPGPLHLEHFLTRAVEIALSDKSDFWIATCQWTYDRYKKSGITSDRLYLTYYGSDISYPIYESGKLRSEFNLREDTFIVGMVAYMYAPKKWLGQKRGIKGHEDFIDALSILQAKHNDIVGVCIGGAWNGATQYEEAIKSYAKNKGVNIIFTGTRRNIGELYQDLNCVVHPSHSENLGGAAESLALGIPTIASNIGGFPDIVINEKTGMLVDAKNPVQLADAIEFMYNNPQVAKKMAVEGQKYVRELLNVKNTSASVSKFYSDIINKYNASI